MKKVLHFIAIVVLLGLNVTKLQAQYCTTPAWYFEGSLADGYGMDQFSISGYGSSSISDVGIIASADPTYGFLSRVGSLSDTMQQGGSYTGTVTYGTSSNYMETQIWIDFNDDSVFEDSEVVVNPVAGFSASIYSFSTPITAIIPVTATPGTHLMRVRCIWMEISTYTGLLSSPMDPCAECDPVVCYYSGDVVDYLVTIVPLPPCSGTPVAGTIIGSSAICGSEIFGLGLTGGTAASGLTYQWQSSPDSATWTNIAGSILSTDSTSETGTTYYRCIVGCPSSPITDTTAGWIVNYFLYCPCTPQYYEYVAFGTPASEDGIGNFSVSGYGTSFINDNGPVIVPADGYEDETSISVTFQQAGSYPGSLTYSPAGYSYENQIWIDFNDDGNFDSSEQVTPVFGTGGCSLYVSGDVFNINIPYSANPGLHRMRVRDANTFGCTNSAEMDPCNDLDATNTYYYGITRDYVANIIPLPPCSGMPTAGTVSAPDSVCDSSYFTISLTGSTLATGLGFQWQSSPDSVTWTSIAGATSISYSLYETASTYYRCIVTCSGLSDTSAGLLEIHSPVCYCTSPAWFSESSLSSGYGMDQFALTGYSGSTLTDAGIIAASLPDGYVNRTSLGIINMQQAGSYSGTVTYGTSADYMESQIWIDFNDDGIFDSSEVVVNPVAGFSSTTYTTGTPIVVNIPFGANPGVHRMRVRTIWMEIFTFTGAVSNPMDPCAESDAEVTYYSGDVADYLANIVPLPPCSGMPTAGTVTGPDSVCDATSFVLSLSGSTLADSLGYQWQSSPDSATWTTIAGATTMTYSASETSSTWFRCIVTCTGLSDTSSGFLEIHSPVCYCTNPAWFSEGSLFYGYAMDSISITGFSGSTLHDTGIIAAADPADGYLNHTGMPALNLQQGSTYSGIVSYGTFSNYMETQIWIDFNDDGIFDSSEVVVNPVAGFSTVSSTDNTPITLNIPLTATLGIHRMRVRCAWLETSTYTGTISNPMDPCAECDPEVCYWSGDVVDYLANIDTLPPCSGTPVAGTVTAPPTVCGSNTIYLGLSGSSSARGLTYQWESSPDSATWTPIAGATSSIDSTTETAATYYRCLVTCTFSTLTDSTPGYLVNYMATCPCTPSYYNYTFYGEAASADGIANFSMAGYLGTSINDNGPAILPADGYEFEPSVTISLEQGGSYPGNVTYAPAGFYYENQIWIDFNDDEIFEPSEAVTPVFGAGGCFYYESSDSFTVNIPITATAGTHLMRVRNAITFSCTNSTAMDPCAYNDPIDDYYYGITRDYFATIYNAPPCTGTPTAGSIVASASSGCDSFLTNLSMSGLTVASGLTFTWLISYDGITWNAIPGDTLTTLSMNIGANTWFEFVVNCIASGSSDTSAAYEVFELGPTISSITNSSPICSGDSITLNAVASGTSQSWTGPDGTVLVYGTSTTIYNASTYNSGTYVFSADSGGCTNYAYTFVIIDSMPVVSISNSPSTPVCPGSPVSLYDSVINPDSMMVYAIPYNPLTFVSTDSLYSASPWVGTCDDGYIDVPIPFTFTFFGNGYNYVNIGANGYVTFSAGSTIYETYALPSTLAPLNMIAPFYDDLYFCDGGSITYGTVGTAPNRQFVISYNDASNCCSGPSATSSHSGQIILYETTNVIDILVASTTYAYQVCGIQDSTGTVAYTAPNENDTYFGHPSPEAWRFAVPSYVYAWSATAGLSSSTISNPVASISSSYVYTVNTSDIYSSCPGSFNTDSVHIIPPSPVFTITGTGSYCAGGTGVDIRLDSSSTGFNYQLYYGTTLSGTSYPGTGGALDFGYHTLAGTYIITATSDSGSCNDTMSGRAIITINPLPTLDTLTGGGAYCAGGTGSIITLTGSDSGVNYQLYLGTVTVGTVVAGTGTAINFGPDTTTGIYQVIAVNDTTSCHDTMINTVSISITPTVTPSISISTTPDTICAGTLAVFTSTVTNGGGSPTYVWLVNGAISGSGAGYSYTPSNGDIIKCAVLSNAPCAVPDTASSNAISLVVDSAIVPVVHINAIPGLSINYGVPDTFIATASGGSGDVYAWKINGVLVTGATTDTLVVDTLSTSDTIVCLVTSTTGPCAAVTGTDTVEVIVTNGVKQLNMGNGDISMIPNPNKGSFLVTGSINTSGDAQYTIKIVDMLGQAVFENNYMAVNGRVNQQIMLGNSMADGAYILYVNYGSSTAMFHFILEK